MAHAKRNRGIAVALLVLAAAGSWMAFTYGGLRWRSGAAWKDALAEAPASSVAAAADPSDVNVVLISIDTLRADHLGCYGYDRPTSPRIDELSERSVVFESAIAQAPSTLPSHASMFTSMLPSHHGALWSTSTALPEAATTIAELLRDAGHAAAGFHGGGQVADELGLGQGFDPYVAMGGRFERQVAAAIEWLDERPAGPFLLFLHTYEVHHPYLPPDATASLFDEDYDGDLPDQISLDLLRKINGSRQSDGRKDPPLPIDDADLAHIVAMYDAEIRSMDAALGALLDALEERALLENALLILTSDHGEEFGEHGMVGWHSYTLYDELLHVPLIVKLPGDAHAGARIAPLVRLLDVAPTVLDVLGHGPHPVFEGASLVPLVSGTSEPPRIAVSQLDNKDDPPGSALRSADWKLYEERAFWNVYRARLFDLRGDPAEQHNVFSANTDLGGRMATELRAIEARRRAVGAESTQVSQDLLQQLRSLGYVD